MKIAVNIARIIVGVLFIFSGLVKAIDPRGLAYKMQEFFEVWARDGYLVTLMNSLDHYALAFSIGMITLEVLLGIALLIGWQTRFTTLLLLLLILFFTFLTAFVLFSGKIRACGCFGDCIPLTPLQTFTKDIILLVLGLLLVWKRRVILPMFKPLVALLIMIFVTVFTLALQGYVLKHLPLVDCLPYKKGNNILKLREMPADAIPDKYEYVFVYEKNGVKKDFTVTALPDSTWTYVSRDQKLVQKGKNNVPLINDFSFSTASGNDTTESVLGQAGSYYLLFIKDLADYPCKKNEDINLLKTLIGKKDRVYVITAQRQAVENRLNAALGNAAPPVFTCDNIAIKTAARANPVLFHMNGPVVQEKYSWADFDEVVR